jgi:protein involved in polysaccharide export with SLBB domain
MKHFIPAWRALSAILLALLAQAALADDASPAPGATPVVENTNLSFSVPDNARASWQHRFTLGPGDILDISMLNPDEADTKSPLINVRQQVAVSPDGRITYLQAQDVVVAGFTIDEVREKLNKELGNYYRLPHVVVTPVSIRSKKYFILGSVVRKGEFSLERPMTLIEAIANAGGLETGVFERNTIEIADLSHSFMVRDGKRLPLDFEKLFQQGDLKQNIPIEPNDYIYFASASANEIYVLGQVNNPGVMPFLPNASVLTAITARGGFTLRAFKARVLIVRGSLKRPETFVVDTAKIIDAKQTDFRLQPRDIVYVATKPWARAEELLDTATSTFMQSVIVTYTGDKIGPFLKGVITPQQ